MRPKAYYCCFQLSIFLDSFEPSSSNICSLIIYTKEVQLSYPLLELTILDSSPLNLDMFGN